MPPSLPSLLGVFGHPDDEALLAGGVLTQHAATGATTAVVTATWAPDSHRAGELAEALAILGAGKPRMLGFADHRIPDSAPGRPRLCDAPLEEVVKRIVEHMRSVRPSVVVTHDAYGQLTGHPDHIRTHQATVLAFHAAGLEHRFPDTGPPWRPRALYAATHPHSGAGQLSTLMQRVGKTALKRPGRTHHRRGRRRPLAQSEGTRHSRPQERSRQGAAPARNPRPSTGRSAGVDHQDRVLHPPVRWPHAWGTARTNRLTASLTMQRTALALRAQDPSSQAGVTSQSPGPN